MSPDDANGRMTSLRSLLWLGRNSHTGVTRESGAAFVYVLFLASVLLMGSSHVFAQPDSSNNYPQELATLESRIVELIEQRDYTEAKVLSDDLLIRIEHYFGQRSAQYATSLSNAANIRFQLSDYSNAASMIEQAVRIFDELKHGFQSLAYCSI
jgi:hypothetical protein